MSQKNLNRNGGHFIPSEKLSKMSKKKLEQDVIKGVQSFADKMVQDIITRATLLAKHNDTDVIDSPEVCSVIEKNFDRTFGIKATIPERNNPSDKHIEKMAEISKQK
ncbi:hypothetical protein ECANGB1_1165 [Enterospora canceri]|uniref:Uncharacterized protein n=1 Tax=Enterospora canceri TaxID=1081671 RepID=A0A1Y1S7T1_9MICR|nr:hypothetical protein ECANGB1_1165 [Enterospora canceri]